MFRVTEKIFNFKHNNYDKMKLRVSENMVLRRIIGPRRDEVTGEWRRFA